eukprot:152112_1
MHGLIVVFSFTIWSVQCIDHVPQSTLYFKSYDFKLNDPNQWNWAATRDKTPTKACTKSLANLCIHIHQNKPGFIIEFNRKQYDFLDDEDWSYMDIKYPFASMRTAPPRRHLMERRRKRWGRGHSNGMPFGMGGMGGLGELEGLGMMPGFGGHVGGMSGMGGMLNANMGLMPPMGGGFGFGLGGTPAGNTFPGSMMGRGNPARRMSNLYNMYSRVLAGKPMMSSHGGYGGHRRHGRHGRHGRRRRHRQPNLLNLGAFGKMGFPSLTGNMMGLVQSGRHMPPFMRIPPQIHITADFRRLLGMKTTEKKHTNVWLNKCVFVEHAEICGAYDLMDASIVLRYIVLDEEYYRIKKGVIDEYNGPYEFKTIVWSDLDDGCNDMMLSFINYTMCVDEQPHGDVIYFKRTEPDLMEGDTANDRIKHMELEFQTSKLSVADDRVWNEIYKYQDDYMQRVCKFMPRVKLCAEVNQHAMKIARISIQIVVNV